jgi:glycosyltransferase involved in cell wall biosynthesis
VRALKSTEASAQRSGERALSIGFVSQGFWPDAGGIEVHLRDLARGLGELGHRVHVLCLDRTARGGIPYSWVDSEVGGVPVRRMRPALEPSALVDLVSDGFAEEVAESWLEEADLDVVHVHHASGFGAGVLPRLAAWGIVVAVTLHDHWLLCPCGQLLHDPRDAKASLACIRRHWPHLLPSGGGEPRGFRSAPIASDREALAARTAAVRAGLKQAEVVLAPAPGVLRAHAELGVDVARARVIEHGIDAAAIAAAVRAERARSPRRAGEPVRLGVLGSVLPAKGVVELAEAFLASGAEGLTLEVHGPLSPFHGDTRHLERLRELARRSERITLHGAYAPSDLPRVLARLDAVAAPALWDEVFGLSVREARAAGLPVLVSDRGGLPPAAQDGRAGRVLPAGDRDAWAPALRELARDADLRARWSAEPCKLRSVAEMAADHERAYLDALG